MKTTKIALALTFAALATVGSSGLFGAEPIRSMDHRIRVDFADPESFTDLRDGAFGDSKSQREYVLGELREFLQKRGDRLLPEGLSLEIRVTDVDLAGDFEPWHGPRFQDVRVIKTIYPTRIRLEFRLTDSTGNVVASGERNLSDFGNPGFRSIVFNSDSLRHEKDLLGDWLNSEFRAQRKARS